MKNSHADRNRNQDDTRNDTDTIITIDRIVESQSHDTKNDQSSPVVIHLQTTNYRCRIERAEEVVNTYNIYNVYADEDIPKGECIGQLYGNILSFRELYAREKTANEGRGATHPPSSEEIRTRIEEAVRRGRYLFMVGKDRVMDASTILTSTHIPVSTSPDDDDAESHNGGVAGGNGVAYRCICAEIGDYTNTGKSPNCEIGIMERCSYAEQLKSDYLTSDPNNDTIENNDAIESGDAKNYENRGVGSTVHIQDEQPWRGGIGVFALMDIRRGDLLLMDCFTE